MGVEGDITGFNWHFYCRLCSHPFWHLLSRYTWADDITLPCLAFLLWKTNNQEVGHVHSLRVLHDALLGF